MYRKERAARVVLDAVTYAAADEIDRLRAALTAAEAQRDAALALAAEMVRPITTQDVRLAAGESKLRPEDVFAGCNAELRRRAAALVASALETEGGDRG